MYSVESCVFQNFPSSASDLKAGIGLSFLINVPLLSLHVSRRYHPDQRSLPPEGESDMQQPILGRLSQSMEALFCFIVPCILDDDQRIVEEDTFRFGLTDVMLSALLRRLPSSQSKPAICSRSIILYMFNIYKKRRQCNMGSSSN